MQNLRSRVTKEQYFASFTEYDKQARRECMDINTYFVSIRRPNRPETEILKQCKRQADAFTRQTRLFDIEWKIVIANDFVESGFPHTHFDTIVIPKHYLNTSHLTETLVHEKIHVFQREFPCECNVLYTEFWNFKFTSNPRGPLFRSNPDINKLQYKDENGQLINATFSNKNNPSLDNIEGDTRDHPDEIMAYTVTHILTDSILRHNLKQFVEKTRKWMDIYFTSFNP
jgi:hypothetical protein